MTDMDDTQKLESSLLLGEGQTSKGEHRQGEETEEIELELHEAERFITFTDAVVAIAMTLLILPLMDAATDMGDEEGGITVADYFKKNGEKVAAFLISFFVVSGFWIGHSKMFQRVENFTIGLVRLNFAWMAGIVFLPVATSLINEAPTGDLIVNLVYTGTFLSIAVVKLLMCLLIRAHPITLKEEKSMPGLLMIVEIAVNIFLLVLALLLSLLVPGAGAYSLFILLPRRFLCHVVQRLRPDWKH
mmetsp:Transcript_4452/g.9626  ORF Transcript_4452/g.9626 Transcript_4452/m.9626 type:complete len:245 (-) Transcript_4452:58-792(-)